MKKIISFFSAAFILFCFCCNLISVSAADYVLPAEYNYTDHYKILVENALNKHGFNSDSYYYFAYKLTWNSSIWIDVHTKNGTSVPDTNSDYIRVQYSDTSLSVYFNYSSKSITSS